MENGKMFNGRTDVAGCRRSSVLLLSCMTSVLIGALVACTQESSPASAGEGKKDGTAAAPEYEGDRDLADAAPLKCNTLTVDGLQSGTLEASTEAPPAGVGGALEDGTYVFVKAILYGASEAVEPSPFLKAKLVLKGDTAQTVSVDLADTVTSTTEKFTPSGSTLTIATTCPKGASDESATYSVLAGDTGKKSIVIYHGTTEVGITGAFYEKQ